MKTIFGWSRYIVLIAVVALLLGGIAVFIFGGITTVVTIVEAFSEPEFSAEGARFLSVEMIELIDLFLLGTILYITSLGLFQLFVDPSIGESLPPWLSVHSIDQLKFNLVAVLIVMLIVLFLGNVAEATLLHEGEVTEAGIQILAYGAGIALVVAAAGAAVMMVSDVVGQMDARHESEEHEHEAELFAVGSHEVEPGHGAE